MSDVPRTEGSNELSAPTAWEPEWPVPGRDNLALVTDDHCVLLLVQDEWGYWSPTKHWPADAVRAAQSFLDFEPTE